jgi:hypothetical protein
MKTSKFIASVLIFYVFHQAVALPLGFFSSAPFVFRSESMYLIDKVLLYSSLYYSPYIISYFALCKILTRIKFKWPLVINYLATSSYLFFNNQYFARGMEVDSKVLYFCLIYIPPLVFLGLFLIQKRTNKSLQREN